jgi:hypothetical protein
MLDARTRANLSFSLSRFSAYHARRRARPVRARSGPPRWPCGPASAYPSAGDQNANLHLVIDQRIIHGMKRHKARDKHAREYEAKIRSESGLFKIGQRPVKMKPHDAAFFRKLGQYVDSADIEGKDTGLLDYESAMLLRRSGVLVLDEEIDPAS